MHDHGGENGPKRLLAIGEAKWNDTLGLGHLHRLETIRTLLRARDGVHAVDTRLLLFSGVGFTGDLLRVAGRDDGVQLIGLDRLYHDA